VVVAPDGVV
jgi:predicted secreted protein